MGVRRLLYGALSLIVLLTPALAADDHASPTGRLPGQSATLLPDGRWLLLGGDGSAGPTPAGAIWNPSSGVSTPVAVALHEARAWHTTTLLPDGTVLILGGTGADGRVVGRVERLDPIDPRVELLPVPGLTPRVSHTATLLTDGRVLVVGGRAADGTLLAHAELWDPRTGTAEAVPAPLATPRAGHTAILLADGRVLISGGVDATGVAVEPSEAFDPAHGQFASLVSPPATESTTGAPELAGSLPEAGGQAVPPDAIVALRFSRPLQVDSVKAQSVFLSGPGGLEAVQVVPAEAGRLAFLTPAAPLQPGTAYTVVLNGPTDASGLAVPFTTLSFTTASAPTAMGPVGTTAAPGAPSAAPSGSAPSLDDEDWTPNPADPVHGWQTGRGRSSWESLPPLKAPPGVTALSGRILRLNGQPLANVTLRINQYSTRTDATGRFLLVTHMSGWCELLIDGRTASRPGGPTYGVFEVGQQVVPGQTTILPYTIWMPKIDTANAVTISSPTTSEVVVTHPRVPGFEVRIPPGTVITDHEHKPVTQVSLTPIPLDRPPFPLPAYQDFAVFMTIQPGGGYVYNAAGRGARVIYPNLQGSAPGDRWNFWHYDPEGRGWYVYGHGHVSPDGTQALPDPGVEVYEFTATVANCCDGGPPQGPRGGERDGEPVDLGTGLFVLQKTDLVLPDVIPIVLTRTYRNEDGVVRRFGIGTSHPYERYLFFPAPVYSAVHLILEDGARRVFTRITPGLGHTDGVFEHTETPSMWYKARITWNATTSAWELRLKDGTVYVFFGQGRLQAIRDRVGNTLTITRSSQTGPITKITSPHGRWVEFTNDTSHRITQVKDNLGRTVSYTYDGGSRLLTVTDPAGGVTEYTYDPNSAYRMHTLKDARGIVYLTNQYDSGGRVTLQTQADGTTFQFTYTLDGGGNVTQADVTNPRGHVRRVTFNASGYSLGDTRALGQPEQQTTTYERQAGTHLVTALIDPLSRRTEYTYDALGNVLTATRLAGTPNAVTTTYTYETTFNQVASVTDPLNHTTSFAYDTLGRLTTITDPLNNQTTLAYNPAGQPTAINAPLGVSTTLGYEAGDLVTITNALGSTTKRFVDGGGRLLTVTDPLGRLTRYTYDTLNRLTQVTDPKSGVTSFTYDPNGNLLSVTDAGNGVTSYTYNTMDRLATRTDPLLQPESFVYDNNGNLTQLTDRKSQVTTYTYDALNRRTQASFASPATMSYTYDAGNRVTQVTDSLAGTITRSYDGLDRLTQDTTPQGSITYTYDAASRRTGMTVAGQPAVAYTYDNGDRLTQVTQGSSSVAVAYDVANRRTSLTLPNGILVEYAYDTASRLTGLTYKLGQTTLGTLTYASDATGSRTQVGGTWARTGLPDPISSATYNAANQQLALGPKTMSYDLNGNLTTLTEAGGTTTFTWDARNRLTGLSGPGLTGSFGYDGLGRRWTKTVNAARTDSLHDGLNPVQEGLLPATPAANLLTGLGIDEYFTRTDVAGTRALLTDALGSPLALTDPTGAVTTEYTYEPFGDTTVSGAANANPFQYTGRENDGTGLYYYRARYYHPGLGRFLSEDPIGLRGGDVNLYAYVWNNPLRLLDPLGLQADNTASRDWLWVKPEKERPLWLRPGEYYPYRIDGVMPPAWGGDWYKVRDHTGVRINPDGTPSKISPRDRQIPDYADRPPYWLFDPMPGRKKEPGWTERHPDWKPPQSPEIYPPGPEPSYPPPDCGRCKSNSPY